MSMRNAFGRLSRKVARFTGSPTCFLGAVAIVLVWAMTGPMFKFNETWQLVINTGTTIITFLMVFLIQSTQNTDTDALQIKLDELIRAIEGADDKMLALEELDDAQLEDLRQQFNKLAESARDGNGGKLECPEIKDPGDEGELPA